MNHSREIFNEEHVVMISDECQIGELITLLLHSFNLALFYMQGWTFVIGFSLTS